MRNPWSFKSLFPLDSWSAFFTYFQVIVLCLRPLASWLWCDQVLFSLILFCLDVLSLLNLYVYVFHQTWYDLRFYFLKRYFVSPSHFLPLVGLQWRVFLVYLLLLIATPPPHHPQVSEALLIFISSLYFNWEVFPGLWSRWKTELSSISSILLCPFSEFVFSDILFFSSMFFFFISFLF